MVMQPSKDKFFDIDDPIATPLIFVPHASQLNWSTDPLPPPIATYKRNPDDIGDGNQGITSDWNFVLPGV
jgi:hypothetical protein